MRDSPLRQLRQYASPGRPALIRFSHTHKAVYSRSFFPRVPENVDEPFAHLDRKKPQGWPRSANSRILEKPSLAGFGKVARYPGAIRKSHPRSRLFSQLVR
jgi:hypothetical protein